MHESRPCPDARADRVRPRHASAVGVGVLARALGEAYLVAASRAKKDFSDLYARERIYRDDLKDQHLWCESLMEIDIEFRDSVEKVPWTDEYKVMVDDLTTTTNDVIAILDQCTKSKKIKTVHSLKDAADAAYLVRQRAAEKLRIALHLSTAPLR